MEDKKHPKLMFISEDGIRAELYIDGVKVTGVKDICIYAYYESAVEHEVKFITANCTTLNNGLIGCDGNKTEKCVCKIKNGEVSEMTGWLGGEYEDLGIFEAKQEAEKGLFGDKLHELLKGYNCKKVKITVEVIDE